MRIGNRTLWVVGAAMSLLLGSSTGMEVKLQVAEPGPTARTALPVTTGVPFGRGALKNISNLVLKSGGKSLPAQFQSTVMWDDGSVRWALLDTQVDVPAGGKTDLLLSDSGGNGPPAAPVKIEDGADAVKVSTGPMQFSVSKTKGGLLESLRVDGRERLKGGRGLVVYPDGGGEVVAGHPESVTVEQAGPLRAVVCVKGAFPEVHTDLLGYTARITAYAGKKHIKIHLWIENRGGFGYYRSRTGEDEPHRATNMDWFVFDGLSLDLGLAESAKPWVASCEGVEAPGHLKVLQVCKASRTREIRRNMSPPLYTFGDMEFTVSTRSEVLKRGDRTDGIVSLRGESGPATVAIRSFWQNYEKAIELDNRVLKFWLWPTEGQYPRPHVDPGYVGDSRITGAAKEGAYQLQGGVHKGHELMLDFSGRPTAETADEIGRPLLALASGEYYAGTEAAPGLFAPADVRTGDGECDAKLKAWMRATASAADPGNPAGIVKGRETASTHTILSFGWMDFGDICLPEKGQTSLAFDWPWLLLANAMRSGDIRSFQLASDMIRHRIDVDTIWSEYELPETRGLVRRSPVMQWHAGRLRSVPVVGDIGLPGLVLFHMLTGEPKALECAQLGGEGLRVGWRWVEESKLSGVFDPPNDMAAVAASMQAYLALQDLTGDKKWLDDALALFRKHVIPTWKKFGPFLHDPKGQIYYQVHTHTDFKYVCAIQGLCELAHRSGDAKVLELLKEGVEADLPGGTHPDASLHFAGQIAFVAQKTGDAARLTRAADRYAQGFPESRSPPLFMNNDPVWAERGALLMRSGHLLQYGAWKLNSKTQ